MYKVSLSESAEKFYTNTTTAIARKLIKCLSSLETEPYRGNNIRRLTGKLHNYYRYRIGDYRVIYRIDEKSKEVLVLLIKHRKDVYK